MQFPFKASNGNPDSGIAVKERLFGQNLWIIESCKERRRFDLMVSCLYPIGGESNKIITITNNPNVTNII